MDLPRAREVVREGQADVAALVIGVVEVVAPERVRNPVGYANEARSIDVLVRSRALPRMRGRDDRVVDEAFDSRGFGHDGPG